MTKTDHTTRKTKSLFASLFAGAALAVSLIGVSAPAAEARPLCMKHAELAVVLKKHKEAQSALGVASNGSLIQVYATEDGATWSIVMTNPQGISCVVAVGKDWDQRKEMVLGQAS